MEVIERERAKWAELLAEKDRELAAMKQELSEARQDLDMERQHRIVLEQKLEAADEPQHLTKSEMIMERCEQYVSKGAERNLDMPA